MKQPFRRGLFTLLSLLALTVFALADMGPKPLLTVRVESPPQEPYYLDLLAEGDAEADLYPNLTDEERAALDSTLEKALLESVPEGWHAALLQGTRTPLWGSLTGEDGVHTFSYMGLPETYRILLVTESGERFLSERLTRTALQSSVTVDWERKTVSAPSAAAGYLLQFLATLLPTLVIEGLLLPAFGFSWRKNRKPFLLINLTTQGALALYFSVQAIQGDVSWWYYLLLIPAETAILLAEALLDLRFLSRQSRRRTVLYAVTANLCSAAAGFLLAEPLWRRIVTLL